ncbi:hypothetical protein [Paenarthrobacter sp. Z7-10]|uniref:hypothetical protein n=1 Tax=Paenarthrobacter sp. Z7-10 TaxID=2787635 RepID=UPI0022A9AB8A|nr:hypothetical protein [Paenarthrobacter sp. Z7-10]
MTLATLYIMFFLTAGSLIAGAIAAATVLRRLRYSRQPAQILGLGNDAAALNKTFAEDRLAA